MHFAHLSCGGRHQGVHLGSARKLNGVWDSRSETASWMVIVRTVQCDTSIARRATQLVARLNTTSSQSSTQHETFRVVSSWEVHRGDKDEPSSGSVTAHKDNERMSGQCSASSEIKRRLNDAPIRSRLVRLQHHKTATISLRLVSALLRGLHS